MSPLISVLMPVLNCAEYVKEASESILNQSFTDFELIIVDDGSTDATRLLVAEYCTDFRITQSIIGHKKISFGAAGALNKGISLARGKYIARQDGDDYSHPGRLERQVAYLENNPECKVVGTGMVLLGNRGKYEGCLMHPTYVTKDRLIHEWPCIAHPTVMMHSHVFADIGTYDETIDYCEDHDLWLRIVEHYGDGSIHNIRDLHYFKREHDATNTAKGKKNGMIELYNEMVLLKSRIRDKKNEI